ncbi:MAG: hypothetical protein OXU31_05965, partial [Gammaproteobacteria bacterium]|nr:hypothetical protein [Gammaproteobacteria bacterium]
MYDLDAGTAALSLSNRDRLRSGGEVTVTLDVVPSGEAARQGSLVDAAGNALADGASYTIMDGIAPVMREAALLSATSVLVTLSEDVRMSFAASDWEMAGASFAGAAASGSEITLEIDPPLASTGLAAGAALAYRGSGSVTDTASARNALAAGASVPVADRAAPAAVSARFVDIDTVAVTFSEAIGAAPAPALSLRGADGAVAATAAGTPAIDTPPGEGAVAASQVTFDIVPASGAALAEGTYWFHGDRGVRDASPEANAHNPRGTDAGVPAALDIPPTLTAWFADPSTISLRASEPLDRATVVAAGSFVVTAPDDTNVPADADALDDVVALAAVPVVHEAGSADVAIRLLAPAKAGVPHTITPAATVADAGGVRYAGGALSAGYSAPFAASTRGLTATVAAFDGGAVSGTLDASNWAMADGGAAVAVSAVTAVDGGAALLIAHGQLASTASTPTVTYSGGDLREGPLPVVAGVPVAASDGAGPSLDASTPPAFTDAGLVITFGEGVTARPGTFLVARHAATGTMVWSAPAVDGAAVTVPVGASPARGEWTVAIPATVTDLAGNARDASAASVAATHAPPATFTATTQGRGLTVINVSEALAGTLDPAHWAVTEAAGGEPVDRGVASVALGTGEAAHRATPGSAVAVSTPGETTLVIAHAQLSSTGARPTVTHTAPAAGGLDAGGVALPTLSVEATDGVPPEFTARTASLTETAVSFGEAVAHPGAAAAGWTVDGAPPSAARAGPDNTLILTHASTGSSAATPDVSYAPPEAPAATAAPVPYVADLAGNPLGAATAAASDGVSPRLLASEPPALARAGLVITFDEGVAARPGTFLVARHAATGTMVWSAPAVAGATLTVPIGEAPADGAWTVSIPATVTDIAGNARDASAATVSATHARPATISAETSGAATTVVTASARLAGTLDVSHWSIAEAVAGLPVPREIAHIALGAAPGAPRASPGAPLAVPAGSQGATLVIHHEALSSTAATPRVSHAAPPSGGLDAGGLSLPSQGATASDGAPPVFTAERSGHGRDMAHTVTLSEPVTLAPGRPAPEAADWSFVGLHAGTGQRHVVASDASRYTPDLGAGTVEISPGRAIRAMDLSKPVSVAYGAADASRASSIVDLSPAANALAPLEVAVSDTAAPSVEAGATSLTTTLVRFTEPVAGATEASRWSVTGDDGAPRAVHSVAASLPGRPAAQSPAELPAPPVHGAGLVITHEALSSHASTPVVAYAPPPGGQLSDAAGNAVAAASVEAADWMHPAITSATLTGQSSLAVRFSEPMSGPIVGSAFSVVSGGSAAATGLPERLRLGAGGTELAVPLDRPVPEGAYTLSVSPSHVTDASPSRNAYQERAPVPVHHNEAPTVSARTATLTSVAVSFSMPVSGGTLASEWAVGGAAPESLSAAPGGARSASLSLGSAKSLTLHLASPLAGTAATPEVSYAAPPGGALLDSPPPGVAPLAVASATVAAADGLAPEAVSAAFDGPGEIVITFSEAVTVPATGWTAAPLEVSSASQGASPPEARLTVGAATPGTYTVGIPAGLADTAAAPNSIGAGASVRATLMPADTAPPTFTAETASATSLVVTFDEPVSGSTAPSEWGVDGARPLSVSPEGPSSATALTLAYPAMGTAATPAVSYSGSSLADGAGNAMAATSAPHVRAADGVAPELESAAFTAAGEITLSFSEALGADTARSAASYAVTVPDGPDAGAEPDAVALSGAAYTAGETAVALALAAPAPEGVPHTIAPTPALTDAAGVPFAGGSAGAERVPDTVPPRAASARMVSSDTITVEFSEPVSGTVATGAWEVRIGTQEPNTRNRAFLEYIYALPVRAVSAPGHDRAQSVAVPAGAPVGEVSLHFAGQPTDTVMFVRHVGSSLSDAAGHAVVRHAHPRDSLEAADAAGPEPGRVYVNPVAPAARQADGAELPNFATGSLIVRPGDRVTFTASWSVIDTTQQPHIIPQSEYDRRIAGPTISYFGGEPVAMERLPLSETTFHTLTIPADAPEGPLRPTFAAADALGNRATATRATAVDACDTALAPRGSIPRPFIDCAHDERFPDRTAARLERVYP